MPDDMSPIKIGPKEKVETNQRTLVIVLGALFTAGCLYTDLKYTLNSHGKAIDALTLAQTTAVQASLVDHELLIHMSDQLRWAVKDQANHEKNPDRDMPRN
jgi:hypothetical protein